MFLFWQLVHCYHRLIFRLSGDIFHGAITYFLGIGYDLETSIKYSSITSAISVTRIGSRYSIPDLEEVLHYDELI